MKTVITQNDCLDVLMTCLNRALHWHACDADKFYYEDKAPSV
jgi:hypothetical protein